MKTVQMTLDEDLVEAVDRVARKLGTSRSAFARDALRQVLARVRARGPGTAASRRVRAFASPAR